jgi:hypothetical protein
MDQRSALILGRRLSAMEVVCDPNIREWGLTCVILFTTSVALSMGLVQLPPTLPALPMARVEACRIEFTKGGTAGKWGGRIAVYDVVTNDSGAVVSLNRRIIEGREHLPPLVRLDQFEPCIRGWWFDGRGAFTVSLLGGSIYEGIWAVEVLRESRLFRLIMPDARPTVSSGWQADGSGSRVDGDLKTAAQANGFHEPEV